VADLRFVFCIHNHQPVGNFDHVIETAYRRAYEPMLATLERYPDLPWVLHNSGCLWEWLAAHHPDYLERVARQVQAGRLELLGGGFYEPILPALAPDDRRGQLRRMRAYLSARFGCAPRGAWLAERVWEPDLPLDLAAAGVAYLPLDDTQFTAVGLAPEALGGALLTESGGRAVRLFPARMDLRYQIPFAPVEAAVAALRARVPPGGLVVYADDGEKFGLWPGTHRRVYGEHWLARFLDALSAPGAGVEMTTFAAEARRPARGRVYLPSGSYAEMDRWSLPPRAQARYQRAAAALRLHGLAAEGHDLLRAGFWRAFFARYPESSWLHQRTHWAARRTRRSGRRLPAGERRAIRDHLWRAQCNCAYWHGLFGGLYLPHLRAGLYRELLRGEARLARAREGGGAWVAAQAVDLDLDGRREHLLENDRLALFFAPASGGRLLEWDDRDSAYNLLNVLARRPESYHRALGVTGPYDASPRAALVDRVYARPPGARAARERQVEDIGDFAGGAYRSELARAGRRLELRLVRDGYVRQRSRCEALRIEKRVRLTAGERGFEVLYRWTHRGRGRLRVTAAIENHFNLLAGDAPDRVVWIDGRQAAAPALAATARHTGVRRVALVEGWLGWHLELACDRPITLVRYPIRTAHMSEAGPQATFQGTALLIALPLALAPGETTRLRLRARVGRGRPRGGRGPRV